MNIAIICGSPRAEGNTAAYSKAFKEGAESAGHKAWIIDAGQMNIGPCKGCMQCKSNGGVCAQSDDMDIVWEQLEDADVIVLGSGIYYFSITGQLQSLITRFYSKGKAPAQKFVLMLSGGGSAGFEPPIRQYYEMMKYWGAEDLGILTFAGMQGQPENFIDDVKRFAAAL